ncbi:MAG: hypothetical protein ACKOZY_11660, partial [Flavobacteriales bacterium]
MRKKRLRILRYTFLSLILLITGFMLSLQTTTMQTWIAQLVAKYAGSAWGTEIHVDQVSVDLWARLHVKGLYIEDQQRDTLAYFHEITLNEYTMNSDSARFTLGTLDLNQPYFNLYYLQGDSIMNLDFLLDAWASDDTTASQYSLTVASLLLRDARIKIEDKNEPLLDQHSMDWNHLYFQNIQANISGIELTESGFRGQWNDFNLQEQSGFALNEFESSIQIQQGHTKLQNTSMRFGETLLQGNLDLGFQNVDQLIDFNHSVELNCQMDTVSMFMQDLAWFSEELDGWQRTFGFSGDVQGRVQSLHLNDIHCSTGERTRFIGDVYLEGLPEIDQTFMEIQVDELISDKAELDAFEFPPFKKSPVDHLETPDNFADLGTIQFKGNFTGFLHEFVVYGDLTTDIGQAKADITMMELDNGADYAYAGDLSLIQFDLGKFYHNEILGPLSCSMNMNGQGLTLNTIDVEISGEIQNMFIAGYNYANITTD